MIVFRPGYQGNGKFEAGRAVGSFLSRCMCQPQSLQATHTHYILLVKECYQGYISLFHFYESDDVMKMENKSDYDDAGDRDLESGRVAAIMMSTITGPSPMRNSVERRLQQVGCFLLLLVISDLSDCR